MLDLEQDGRDCPSDKKLIQIGLDPQQKLKPEPIKFQRIDGKNEPPALQVFSHVPVLQI